MHLSFLAKIFLERKYFPLAFGILVFSLISAFCEGMSFLYVYEALSSSSSTKELLNSRNAADIFSSTSFFTALSFAICLQMLRAFGIFLSAQLFARLASSLQQDVQKKLLRQLLSFPFPHFSKKKRGSFAEIFSLASSSFFSICMHLHSLLHAVIFFIVLLCFMLHISWFLSVISLLLFALIGLLYRFLTKTTGKKTKAHSKKEAAALAHIIEAIQGMKEIHSHAKQDYMEKKLIEELQKCSGKLRKANIWNAMITYSFEWIGMVHVGVVFLCSSYSKEISFSLFATFIGLSYRFAQKLPLMAQSFSFLLSQWGNMQKLQDFLEEKTPSLSCNSLEKTPPFTSISCKNVTFRYPGEEKDALVSLNFSIKEKQTIAIVGKSGSGKSTFFDLLLRLYAPEKGTIFWNGNDCRKLSLRKWRSFFAIASQEPFFFAGSIEENIRFGNNKLSFDTIEELAHLVGADIFIKKLPRGYQTVLGEGGEGLSGGEKQRLSILRALCKKPAILLLDEPTSHLDSSAEKVLQDCLYQLQGRVTMIITAHRLRNITKADKICLFSEGTIVEEGRHEDLLQSARKYVELWQLEIGKTIS